MAEVGEAWKTSQEQSSFKCIMGKSVRQNVYWPFWFQDINTAFLLKFFMFSFVPQAYPLDQVISKIPSHPSPLSTPHFLTPPPQLSPFYFGAPLFHQVLASSDWFINHLGHLSELCCFTCNASSQGFVSFDLQERALLYLGFPAVCLRN